MTSKMPKTTTRTIIWGRPRIYLPDKLWHRTVELPQAIIRCMTKKTRIMTPEIRANFTRIGLEWLSILRTRLLTHFRRIMWGLRWHTWVLMPSGGVRDLWIMSLLRCLSNRVPDATPLLRRQSLFLVKTRSRIIVRPISLKWSTLTTRCASTPPMRLNEWE